jgi:hypothetical protein
LRLYFNIIAISIVLCIVGGCSKHYSNQPNPNRPPSTFVTLIPDSTLRSTTSQQHVHWWGVDPDGFVKGYYISLDSLIWTFTTSNDSVLGLKLNTSDTTYTFYVAAVDDQGLRDPKPASLRYPIHNTPPVVSFIAQTDVPDTTYTVATFQWSGFDLDGNESIVAYQYVLDDTTKPWTSLTGDYNRITLYKSDGLTAGQHVFYLRARDIAGALSKTIRMPDSTTWYVKDPVADGVKFLIINDYTYRDDGAASWYSHTIDSVIGSPQHAYVWDIKALGKYSSRYKYVPAVINPTFTESIKLFKYVLWFTDLNPQMNIAQAVLYDFEQAGGKVLFIMGGFPQYPTIDPRGFGDFAPITNMEDSSYFVSTIVRNRNGRGDSVIAVDAAFPSLYYDNGSSTEGVQYYRALLPKTNAHTIYQMGKSPAFGGWSTYTKLPIVMGVADADRNSNPSIVMLAFALHRFSGNPTGKKLAGDNPAANNITPNNAPLLLYEVLYNEFGVR